MGNTEIILYVVLTTLLMLLLIAGIAIAFFISNRQRAKQQVELVQTRLGYEKELRKVEAEVSEQLMLKFAQELHDNVGQLLTCMHLEVENRKIDYPSLEAHLRPIGQYIEDATNQLRLLSRSLNTEYVTHIGLRRAIEIEIERHRQLRKFTIEWQCGGDVSVLDKNQQLVVFRIFQEVLHNATRHSGARKVAITLVVGPNFELVILDDGKGFSPDRVFQSADASGLRNIMRRAAMAGLSCNLKTAPGEGCCYTLRLISTPTLSENNQALVHGK